MRLDDLGGLDAETHGRVHRNGHTDRVRPSELGPLEFLEREVETTHLVARRAQSGRGRGGMQGLVAQLVRRQEK